jgi:hypothetical protein
MCPTFNVGPWNVLDLSSPKIYGVNFKKYELKLREQQYKQKHNYITTLHKCKNYFYYVSLNIYYIEKYKHLFIILIIFKI